MSQASVKMREKAKRRFIATLAAGVVLAAASPAMAQWGEGVQGEYFRVHPGVTFSVGYDSNVYFSSAEEEGLSQAPEGLVEPRLSLSTINGGSWDLSADAKVGWRQYFTGDQAVRNQSGLSAGLGAGALWNGEGAFSLRFTEQFVRTNETPSYRSPTAINRIYNKAGVMAGLHPGGRILETYLSYDFSLYRHNLFSDLDRHTHHFGWNGQWSFLPKTAFVADVDYRLIRYSEAFLGADRVPNVDERIPNVNSAPLRLTGGVAGQVTPRISTGLRAGYGWGFYEDGPTVQAFLARAEASYQFGRIDYGNRLRAGYERGFRDSSIGNYFQFHRFVMGYEQGFVGNRLRLSLEVNGQIRDYAELGVESVQTVENRVILTDLNDLLLGVDSGMTFEIRKGWDLGVRYGFRSNFTEDRIVIEGPAEDSRRDYQRHHVLLSTELTY